MGINVYKTDFLMKFSQFRLSGSFRVTKAEGTQKPDHAKIHKIAFYHLPTTQTDKGTMYLKFSRNSPSVTLLKIRIFLCVKSKFRCLSNHH